MAPPQADPLDPAAAGSGQAVEAIAMLAHEAAAAQELEPGKLYLKAGRDGPELIDLLGRQDHLPHPVRKRGSVVVRDAPSLVAYVNRHKTDATVLYANPDVGSVVAVLNDHAAEDAGWGDFRATLRLAFTKEWLHWTAKDGRLMGQVEFAEHLEQGLDEIVAPPAAAMLELAQHFEATGKVAFKSARTLADGARQLHYEQTVESRAGEKGDLKIPGEFELGVAPFEGGDRFKLVARLRYRIADETLRLGYALVRPHKVQEQAFGDVLAAVEQGTGCVLLRGSHER